MKNDIKEALISGVTGQEGAHLAEYLFKDGYEARGIKHRTSLFNTHCIVHFYQISHERERRFVLRYGDMTDSSELTRILQHVEPDEIYNLAAQTDGHWASTSSGVRATAI